MWVKIIKKALLFVALLGCLLVVPLASCKVTLGGTNGNVTLINPDGSTLFFDYSNATTYAYVTNLPDGWWNILSTSDTDNTDYMVFAVVIGIIALALAVIALVWRLS